MRYFSESNGCLTSEGFCHHSCVRTASGFSCACKSGFMLDSNSVTCTGRYLGICHHESTGYLSPYISSDL